MKMLVCLLALIAACESTAAPRLVQYNSAQTQGTGGENNTVVKFAKSTVAHDSIWVAATVADYAGIHKITVKDSQGNRFVPLDQENDPHPGSQTVAHFVASDIKGGPDTVTVEWGFDNYKGGLIAEVSGTLAGHAARIQDGLAAGSDNITVGPVISDHLLFTVALSMDTTGGSSDLGGSGAHGPEAGNGFEQQAVLWKFGQPLATLETRCCDAPSTEALFSATHKDSYVTLMAVFQ